MNAHFTLDSLRADIRVITSIPGWSVNRLARESAVDQASLSRFLAGASGLTGANIEKLWPFLYGDRRPSPAQPQDTPGDGPGVPQDELSSRGASPSPSRAGEIDSGASQASSTPAAA